MKNKRHIGMLIKSILKERGMSVKDFADAIHKKRANVYNLFTRGNISTELLLQIEEVLQYNLLIERNQTGAEYHMLVIAAMDEAMYEKWLKSPSIEILNVWKTLNKPFIL